VARYGLLTARERKQYPASADAVGMIHFDPKPLLSRPPLKCQEQVVIWTFRGKDQPAVAPVFPGGAVATRNVGGSSSRAMAAAVSRFQVSN
jgi:hypothetical protein